MGGRGSGGASGGGARGGGSGGASKSTVSPIESAKVSYSGVLPTDIKASNESEAVELFNKANANSDGIGYKIVRNYLGICTIAITFNGKVLPENIEPRTKAFLYRTSRGTWAFGQ